MKLPHGLRALQHRNFRLFLGGQGTSQIGTWLQLIATSWLVYHLSGSTFLLGLAAFALQIPYLALAPVTGVMVDRFPRRRVLLITNSIAATQALIMFALVAHGSIQPWHLVAGNLVLGIVNAFDAPARQTLLIELVGSRTDLANAIALNSTMMNSARFVGPSLGGAVIAAFGEAVGFGVNALTYFAAIGALLAMRFEPRPPPSPREGGLARQFAAGLRYAYGFLPSRSALLLLAGTSLTVQNYTALMPWFAKEAFGGGSGTLGLLIGAAGLGAVSSTLYLAARPDVRGLMRVMAWSAALAGGALAGFAFAPWLWLALPLLFCVGVGVMLVAASTNTVLQTIVPDELRGRVASLYAMSFIGMTPIGALAAGWVAERIGPPATVACGGALALLAAALYARQLPAIRREIRPVYEKLGIAPRPAADVPPG